MFRSGFFKAEERRALAAAASLFPSTSAPAQACQTATASSFQPHPVRGIAAVVSGNVSPLPSQVSKPVPTVLAQRALEHTHVVNLLKNIILCIEMRVQLAKAYQGLADLECDIQRNKTVLREQYNCRFETLSDTIDRVATQAENTRIKDEHRTLSKQRDTTTFNLNLRSAAVLAQLSSLVQTSTAAALFQRLQDCFLTFNALDENTPEQIQLSDELTYITSLLDSTYLNAQSLDETTIQALKDIVNPWHSLGDLPRKTALEIIILFSQINPVPVSDSIKSLFVDVQRYVEMDRNSGYREGLRRELVAQLSEFGVQPDTPVTSISVRPGTT